MDDLLKASICFNIASIFFVLAMRYHHLSKTTSTFNGGRQMARHSSLTLRQQAFRYALSKGWSTESAQTVADDAVEISESNLPLSGEHFKQVMREAMRTSGE